MEAIAHLKSLRIAPRKVQIVLDQIRNKPINVAAAILIHTRKSACEPLLKLLRSAAANAGNNLNMNVENLYVAKCFVCPGSILKRMRPLSHGRSTRILKRTSHITIVLKEKS
ncbi:MAG: 50S ribosomal protein L22 [Oscillospiraceae bacterium]|jgi:large subunit ribosomal protein L22|nr:50S ribosomal protein L22 [Oscillospiraceae bacterium]